MSIIRAESKISHTFGNVACAVMEYLKGEYFEKDYFQTEHISTKLSSKQLNVYRAKKDFWKNQKPMLIIRPRIDLDDSSNQFYGSAMTNRMTNSRSQMEFANLVPMLENKEFGTRLAFIWNKLRVTFDIAIVVETYNEQLDKAHMLKNSIDPGNPFPYRTPLEATIPGSLMAYLADHLGVPRDDTSELLYYLNTYAGTPVTYKLKNSSGNHEFFMLYDTNIEMITSEITIDDGEGTGMVQDTYTISFSVSAEFYGVGMWYLMLKNLNPEFLITGTSHEPKVGDTIVPILSIPLKYDLHLGPGWEIYSTPCYVVSDTEKDVTDLTPSISRSVANLIKIILSSGTYLSDSFIRFECFKGTKRLEQGKGYQIDIQLDPSTEHGLSITITTYDCRPYVTYRVFVLINNFAINSIAAEVQGFHKET